MQGWMLWLFFLVLPVPVLCAEVEPLPREAAPLQASFGFADFAVELSTETLSQVDFSSHPDASSFAARFNALVGRAAKFAGHYRLLYWGCGTACQQFAIVDVKTGQVFMDEGWSTSLGLCFRADSALLITNPGADESMRIERGHYHWDGKQLSPLGQASLPMVEHCDNHE